MDQEVYRLPWGPEGFRQPDLLAAKANGEQPARGME